MNQIRRKNENREMINSKTETWIRSASGAGANRGDLLLRQKGLLRQQRTTLLNINNREEKE